MCFVLPFFLINFLPPPPPPPAHCFNTSTFFSHYNFLCLLHTPVWFYYPLRMFVKSIALVVSMGSIQQCINIYLLGGLYEKSY
jgi:hypothetical protein